MTAAEALDITCLLPAGLGLGRVRHQDDDLIITQSFSSNNYVDFQICREGWSKGAHLYMTLLDPIEVLRNCGMVKSRQVR